MQNNNPSASPQKPNLVLVLHGLGNTSTLMSLLCWYLRCKGFSVMNLGYPSLSYNCQDLAGQISQSLLKEWDKGLYKAVDLVGFSLGSQLARIIIDQLQDKIAFSRLVMIGPPNQGAALARFLRSCLPTSKIWGPVFEELRAHNLPNPCNSLEVGIIAGGTGFHWGINPFLRSDNDGLVKVEETILSGAKEHKLIFAIHAIMPLQPGVMRLTARFLRTGEF